MAKRRKYKSLYNNGEVKKKEKRLKSSTKKGILAICFFTLAILAILSRFDKAGPFGHLLYQGGNFLFGWGFILIPVVLLLASIALVRALHKDLFLSVFIGAGLLIGSTLSLLHIVFNRNGQTDGVSRPVGGLLGQISSWPLLKFFGSLASIIILAALIIIGWLVTFNVSLKRFFVKKPVALGTVELGNTEQKFNANSQQANLPFAVKPAAVTAISSGRTGSGNLVSRLRHLTQRMFTKPNFQVKTISQPVGVAPLVTAAGVAIPPPPLLPPLDLLVAETGQANSGDIQSRMNIIQRTLKNFSIEVEMSEVNIGPTVARYTLKPSIGVRLSKITALQSDLSLALAAHPIRIEAPIPGRSLVGIEVPNQGTFTVRLRNLIEHENFVKAKSFLTFAIGRDVAGEPVYANIAKMPHMLIAGATGTGKTVCLNSLILSLLYKNTPETLKLILVDPKRVEFSLYADIPHLLCPVVVETEKTVATLRWAVAEMERRFSTLAEVGSKDIDSFNARKAELARSGLKPLPYIVIVIDELADLMASYGRDVESLIVRLAQMARAVGIHLVVSTQRPSVEVITGLIKANITSRIALQVASQIDSRTILDQAGAEKLLGNGDMIFVSAEAGRSRRVQGVFVSEKEVKGVADYLRKNSQPSYYDISLKVGPKGVSQNSAVEIDEDDTLLSEARRMVIEARKASASLLQRRLRIGYARAARLLDLLEKEGVVGQQEGSRPREVLLDTTAGLEE